MSDNKITNPEAYNKAIKLNQDRQEKEKKAYLEYMGILNVSTLKHEDIIRIKEEGEREWLFRELGLTLKDEIKFESRRNSWWWSDRFILHPEIYHDDLKTFIRVSLPNDLAKYIRGQFRGSSERITNEKILDAIEIMQNEMPIWWRDRDTYKKTFLDRFSIMYPNCCDGDKPKRTLNTGAAHVNINPSSLPTKINNFQSKPKSKILRYFIVCVIIIVLILFVIRK